MGADKERPSGFVDRMHRLFEKIGGRALSGHDSFEWSYHVTDSDAPPPPHPAYDMSDYEWEVGMAEAFPDPSLPDPVDLSQVPEVTDADRQE